MKRESGDYLQSHAENPVSRYKRIISGRLLSQWDEARERETPTRLLPIEVKTSRTLGKRDLRGLTAFLKEYAETTPIAVVLYGGREWLRPARNVIAIPWSAFLGN